MFDFDVRSGTTQGTTHDTTNPVNPLTVVEVSLDMTRSDPSGPGFAGSIAQIPRRSALVVAPSALLGGTVRLMEARRSQAALIGSHGVLLGMLTVQDLIRRLPVSWSPRLAELPVSNLMEVDPQTLHEGDSIGYAIQKLSTLGGRPMPVVHPSGALAGLLESQDILAWLCGRLAVPHTHGTARGASWKPSIPPAAEAKYDNK